MVAREIRILFTGTPGCGKTTAVHTVGALACQHARTTRRRTTTIGQDYAELPLAGDIVLRCYGTPGQRRFAFIWELLARTADGLIILVDETRPTPVADMEMYLENFHELVSAGAALVCVVKAASLDNTAVISGLEERMQAMDLKVPLIFADTRDRQDMLRVVDKLLQQLAARS